LRKICQKPKTVVPRFKVMNVSTLEKLAMSDCYDKQQVCVHLQPFSPYRPRPITINSKIAISATSFFDAGRRSRGSPSCTQLQKILSQNNLSHISGSPHSWFYRCRTSFWYIARVWRTDGQTPRR